MNTKILLTVLFLELIIQSIAQNPTIELSFTVKYNELYVPLDSVLIENITQGGDTMLYSPDTILVLEYITSINESSTLNTFKLFQNYPNPFTSETSLHIQLPYKDRITITVYDLNGSMLVNYDDVLNAGRHEFTFYPGNTRQYILTARSIQKLHSIKMVNLKPIRNNHHKLMYKGLNAFYKSSEANSATDGFGFNPGDELQFTVYALTEIGNLGSAIETDTPEISTDYEFNILEGLRCPGMPTVSDVDGNIYNTVLIGEQCWMKENLKTTTYNNSTPIQNVSDSSAWTTLLTGAYVWYDNDISWKDKYGALYNWFATVDTNGLCPVGWHVPTNNEWIVLTNLIGGIQVPHGNELKSCRQVNSILSGDCNTIMHPRWNEHNTHFGTDNYGFSGLPGGYRMSSASFLIIGEAGMWWSSTETSSSKAWLRVLWYGGGDVDECDGSKLRGFSIRCLKD